MTPEEFEEEVRRNVEQQGEDVALRRDSVDWMIRSAKYKYSYNFRWLGRPIIQFPQDIVAMQELVWSLQPDLVIETGIAHGGSLIFYASLLELNALCGGPANAIVFGVDIDIRSHNRSAIEAHPLAKRVVMVEGSSTDPDVVRRAAELAGARQRVLVCLDSNHTHDHVLAELHAYSPLASVGSYCVVFDTFIEALPPRMYPDRPWDRGNNPGTAVRAFLAAHPEFQPDKEFDAKLLISVAPGGFLKRLA